MLISKTINNWNPKYWDNNTYIKKLQPLFPLVLAQIAAFIYHPDFADTIPRIMMYAIIPGTISASGFKVFKSIIFEKAGIPIEDDDKKKRG